MALESNIGRELDAYFNRKNRWINECYMREKKYEDKEGITALYLYLLFFSIGRPAQIQMLRGKTSSGDAPDLLPVLFKDQKWSRHYICVYSGFVYDPIFPNRISEKNYPKIIFPNQFIEKISVTKAHFTF